MIVRQGDVLLRRVASVPLDLRPVARDRGRIVLAYGEVTGHAHAIVEPTAELLTSAENERFLRIVETAFLRHEEHGTLTLEPGIYQVIGQREWTDEDEPRAVVD